MKMHHSRNSHSGSSSDRNSLASNDGGRSPAYLLEHLATFTVSPENDLVYPADGMRRLLAMEKTSGIWTQKMLMRLERKMVNIMDHENKEVVERFPVHLVREPTAFTSNDPKEMYNNIVIYIVGHPPEESPSPNEMHIFQCVNVSARDVVEDLKAFKQGRYRPAEKSPQISPNDVKPNNLSPSYDGSQASPRMHAQLENSKEKFDETSSTSSDKYEKDVNILNRCFDDIEKFIARLQHAAAAFRELEKRRRSRKSKKKDLGDGMLSMRAKPPPEREFEDIFQKFKLSFNLLAKLKAHIHDPNAPELVHFLFTPLALIVDASHDSHYGPNLPTKVLSPLLTKSAVDLLINCLTSKESELWHSLGEPWYVPKEQWKGYVPPYKPVFMDGWSPAMYDDFGGSSNGDRRKFHGEGDDSTLNEDEDGHILRAGHTNNYGYGTTEVMAPTDSENERNTPVRYNKDVLTQKILREERASPSEHDFSLNNRHAHSPNSESAESDQIERTGEEQIRFERQQRNFMMDLMNKSVKVVQVTYPRTANNEKELTVSRGEFLEVLDDTRKWWKTRNVEGRVGHVPHTIVTPAQINSDNSPQVSPKSAEWIQKERRGKKGEFRYF
eukprot:GFUD01005568.1.p1 GENE.GFUD01005568.1~~GFUD01005568.1.p1  ORF type:complete len:611 (+),score=76.32 GFUD01005568.1:395-2227(+)